MTEANGASADLVAALGELAEIQAAQTADTGTYKYRYADLAQIMSTVRPILAKHNLAVTQLVSSTHEGELLVRTVLLHASGTEFDMDPLGAKMPVTPQQVGSFISYFRRYQLTGRLGLAVEDDDGQAAAKAPKQPAKKASRDPQTDKAMALFHELGIVDRKQRLRLTSLVVKREVGSWNDLDGKEKNVVIDDLQRRLSAAETAVRMHDADDQLDRDLIAAAAVADDEAERDQQDMGVARFDLDVDEPKIDSDLDDIHNG